MHKATVARFLNILAVGLVGFGALLAVSGTVAEAADPTKSASGKEWDSLVRAARKEGKLVVAAGGQPSREYRPTFNAFSKKFGVTVQVSSGSATDTLNRVFAERRAGLFNVDIGLLSVRSSNVRLIPAGAVVPLPPLIINPEVRDQSKWHNSRHWYGDAGQRVFIYDASVSRSDDFWYNTDKISKKAATTIKGPRDFFDSKWKGKIASLGMGDPSGLRSMVLLWLDPSAGEEWVKRWLTSKWVRFVNDRRQVETWLTGGSSPLNFPTADARSFRRLSRRGLPIKEALIPRATPALAATGSGCCITVFAKRPHPSAAKLFLNWFLSKEGQTLHHRRVTDIDRQSLRDDIPMGNVQKEEQRPPEAKDFNFPDADPAFWVKAVKVNQEILEIWQNRR